MMGLWWADLLATLRLHAAGVPITARTDDTTAMSNRLTQIATRTGDDGSTGLGDGTRVPKSHQRVAAMGDVDELNSGPGRAAGRAAAGRTCASCW